MTAAQFKRDVDAEIYRRFVEPFRDPTRATTHFVHDEDGAIDGPFDTAGELTNHVSGSDRS